MAHLAYDQMRQCNVGENTKILQQLGVSFPTSGSRVMLNRPAPRVKQRLKPKPKPQPKNVEIPLEGGSSGPRLRSSFRVQLKQGREIADDYFKELEYDNDDDYDEDNQKRRPKPYVKKVPRVPMPNSYGSIPGVEVGRWWETRMECNGDGVHRPTVAGIHGGPDGAYSLALSGGYEDDVDVGESFTYTGEGGRDLKGTASQPKNLRTAPQSKDQVLDRGNLALARSVETGNPVRVIRGYKLNSKYAPESGYRYDGLYKVKKYWQAVGKSGFKVYKFALVRCDPEPVPWKILGSTSELDSEESCNSETEEGESSSTVSPTADPNTDVPDESSLQLTPRNKRKTRNTKQVEDIVASTEVSPVSDPSAGLPTKKSSGKKKVKLRKSSELSSLNGAKENSAVPTPGKQDVEKTVMFMETEDESSSPLKCNTSAGLPTHKSSSKKSVKLRKSSELSSLNGAKENSAVLTPGKQDVKNTVIFMETEDGSSSPLKSNTSAGLPTHKSSSKKSVKLRKSSELSSLNGAKGNSAVLTPGKQDVKNTVMFMETEDGSLSPVKCNTPQKIKQCLVALLDINANSPPKVKLSPPPVVMQGCLGWKEDSILQSNAVRFHLSVKNCDGPGTFVRFVDDQWIEECKQAEATVNCLDKLQTGKSTSGVPCPSPSSDDSKKDLKEDPNEADWRGWEDDSEDLDWRWLKEDYEQDWKGWSRVEPIPVPKFQFYLVE